MQPTSRGSSPVPRAQRRGADDQERLPGPMGIKEPTAATWYEPLEEQDDIDLAVHWVLGLPDVFLNSVGDLRLLPAVLDAAERFESRPNASRCRFLPKPPAHLALRLIPEAPNLLE